MNKGHVMYPVNTHAHDGKGMWKLVVISAFAGRCSSRQEL